MRRLISSAAVILGVAAIGAASPVFAQPRDGDDHGDGRASGYDGGRDRDHGAYDGRESDGRDGDQWRRDERYSDRHDDDHDRREAHDDGFRHRGARHFCGHEDGWRGHGSYACGYAWRARRGWAGAYDGDYEYRGLHYRGYWEDGTGRRFYDRGGYGVGYCDYGGPRPWSC